MKLQLFNAAEFGKPLKVTIQSTGRLGFTDLTAHKLELDTDTYVRFYIDEDNVDRPIVEFIRMEDHSGYRVMKSGQYFYLSTSAFFQRLGFDYNSGTIICDLHDDAEARAELHNDMVYRLVRRPEKKSKKKSASQE